MHMGVSVVPDLEIERRQIAKLFAGQVQVRFLRHATLVDSGQCSQRVKKDFPFGQ